MLGTGLASQTLTLACASKEREAAKRRTVEVAYNLRLRIRQELAYPAVLHFYAWLLQGALGPAGWRPCSQSRHKGCLSVFWYH